MKYCPKAAFPAIVCCYNIQILQPPATPAPRILGACAVKLPFNFMISLLLIVWSNAWCASCRSSFSTLRLSSHMRFLVFSLGGAATEGGGKVEGGRAALFELEPARFTPFLLFHPPPLHLLTLLASPFLLGVGCCFSEVLHVE